MAIIEKLKKNIKKHFFPGRETNAGRWSGNRISTNCVVFSRQTQMALMSQQDFFEMQLSLLFMYKTICSSPNQYQFVHIYSKIHVK